MWKKQEQKLSELSQSVTIQDDALPTSIHSPPQDEDDDAAEATSIAKRVEKAITKASGMDNMGGYEMGDLAEKGMSVPLILMYSAFWMVCLVYFTVTLTISESERKYLGMQLIVDDSQVCEEVPLVSSGVFSADSNGNWQTSASFNFNQSIYALELQASTISNSDYVSLMARYQTKLKDIGTKAAARDVAWNWMAWSTLNFIDSATKTRFYSLGDAATVYNLDISAAAVASYSGVCTNTIKKKTVASDYGKKIQGSFDGKNFVISYPVVQDPVTGGVKVSGTDQTKFGPCSDQGYLQDVWSWSAESNPDFTYTAKFDAQTTATIIGLNLGLLKKEDLTTTRALYDYDFLNLPKGAFYIDPYKVPMNPIYCLADSLIAQSTATTIRPDVCFYPYGRKPLLLYPVTAQWGKSENGPQNCQCTSDQKSSHYLDFNSTECNVPSVLVGYFYNTDGSANKSTGVVKFALNMQTEIMLKGDYRVAEVAFPAMADSAYMFQSNVQSATANAYCPGGSSDSGAGNCLGVCSYDYTTSCVTSSDCQTKSYSVIGDDAYAVASLYTSDDEASCLHVCSTDINVGCTTIMSSSPECPGTPGLGCIQPTYQKSNAEYWNETKYYSTAYDPSTQSDVIKTKYPISGQYDYSQGGCKCVGFPTASTAGSISAATDDFASSAESSYYSAGSSSSNPSVPIIQTTAYPITYNPASYGYVENAAYSPTLYKPWCCPGVTKCECVFQNGTAIYSPTRYNSKCCPDSTKCWCSDHSKKASCCTKAYDTLCCDARRTYDNGTNYVSKNMKSHFNAICPDKKCAAIVFLLETSTGIFNPVNKFNVVQKQLSESSYREQTYKFIKATQKWVSVGIKTAERIMCIDTFYNQTMIDKLGANPPMPLVQSYVQCKATLINALQTAVGVAAGSASLYANTAMAIVCFIIFYSYNIASKEKLTPANKKQEGLQRRQKRADDAMHGLIGTIAEEYIDVKRTVAGRIDPGIERMAARLKVYLKYYPNDRNTDLDALLAEEEEEEEEIDEEEEERKAWEGRRVGLHGLKEGSPYNGAIGKCTAYELETDAKLFRVTIIAPNHLRGKRVKVQFENLYEPTVDEVARAKAAPAPSQGVDIGGLVGCPQQ